MSPQAWLCGLDQVSEADLIIGDAHTGEQLGVCRTCLVAWCLAQLDELVPPEQRRVIADHFADTPDAKGEASGPPATPQRRRRGRPTPSDGTAAPTAPEDQAAATADGR